MKTSATSRWLLGFLFFACGLIPVGCSRTPSRQIPLEKTRPLAGVDSGDKNLSTYAPPNPYKQVASGLFTRTVYQSDGPPGYSVEIRDLSVVPKERLENISLPGAAFAEVRYGAGVFAVGEKRQELNVGSTFSVSQGQSFNIEATPGPPLTIRVYLIAPH